MSEFNSEETPNTIALKGSDALTAAEKLRLVYLTGTEQVDALPTPRSWEGTTEQEYT